MGETHQEQARRQTPDEYDRRKTHMSCGKCGKKTKKKAVKKKAAKKKKK